LTPSSVTPDGRQIACAQSRPGGDITIVTFDNGVPRTQPLFETPASERWPEFSPDGRWLAYGSDASGGYEVYVRPYPGLGAAEPVSVNGGSNPAWHPNGRELFFLSVPDSAAKRRMMTTFEAGSPPRVGTPRALSTFDTRELSLWGTPVHCYDVAPDGQQFYGVQVQAPPPPPVVTHVNLIQNWFEELKAKVPGR
jgi:serine/threonine-protein kinase